ncbi:hypothetical protein GWI33_006499 [Rhynchophorus ferrugineus]|uniref:Uncharacterized protein n=1 Tax=Rhynchophorus ferrugineus TaxID=354439 RepID=A0A834IIY3_RHYFE|nr:hypothetical protein GWI33_006499 [Rhynchophorus ferrugineus]
MFVLRATRVKDVLTSPLSIRAIKGKQCSVTINNEPLDFEMSCATGLPAIFARSRSERYVLSGGKIGTFAWRGALRPDDQFAFLRRPTAAGLSFDEPTHKFRLTFEAHRWR